MIDRKQFYDMLMEAKETAEILVKLMSPDASKYSIRLLTIEAKKNEDDKDSVFLSVIDDGMITINCTKGIGFEFEHPKEETKDEYDFASFVLEQFYQFVSDYKYISIDKLGE